MSRRETSETVPAYSVGDRVYVRQSGQVWKVTGAVLNKGRKLAHRYYLTDEAGTNTQAYAEDMRIAPPPEPAQELSLVLDPESPDERLSQVQAAAMPAGFDSFDSAGLDSVDATDDENPLSFGSLVSSDSADRLPSLREQRAYPAPLRSRIGGHVYSARFKGMENLRRVDIDEPTPLSVVVTKETNGHAVWIEMSRSVDDISEYQLEEYYPTQAGSSDRDAAIEHGVLLALRKVKSRQEDVESILLMMP